MDLKATVAAIPDFPKAGILFRDVSPMLRNPAAYTQAIKTFAGAWRGKADAVVALDARGFIFGAMLAYELHLPFVMVRKKGKLPGTTVSQAYGLEYGQDVFEVQEGALDAGARVLIVDDLLATGGSAAAAAALVKKVGAQVAGFGFVIELCALNGKEKLPAGASVYSLLCYDKEDEAAAAA
jgi:adenine phosphoribosyltransferase